MRSLVAASRDHLACSNSGYVAETSSYLSSSILRVAALPRRWFLSSSCLPRQTVAIEVALSFHCASQWSYLYCCSWTSRRFLFQYFDDALVSENLPSFSSAEGWVKAPSCVCSSAEGMGVSSSLAGESSCDRHIKYYFNFSNLLCI